MLDTRIRETISLCGHVALRGNKSVLSSFRPHPLADRFCDVHFSFDINNSSLSGYVASNICAYKTTDHFMVHLRFQWSLLFFLRVRQLVQFILPNYIIKLLKWRQREIRDFVRFLFFKIILKCKGKGFEKGIFRTNFVFL